MNTFNFRKADNRYKELFFQFPKVLYYSQKYKKNLSLSAKAAYMVLMDREEYSLRNNWIDEDGNVYFIFTNQELADLLDVSLRTVINIKKELENANLLLQKKMGFNPKTGKNEPNRLYLAELEVNATDVYLRGEYNKNTPQTVATSGSANSALNLYNNSLDTLLDKNKDTNNLDFSSFNFSKDQLDSQNQDLVKNSRKFLKEGTHELFLSEEAIHLLEMWCNTPQQMRKIVGIILNAKNAACKDNADLGVHFILEEDELQEKILNTLRRYFNAIRTKEKSIANHENYLYGTMLNMFAEYWNEQAFAELGAKKQ